MCINVLNAFMQNYNMCLYGLKFTAGLLGTVVWGYFGNYQSCINFFFTNKLS